MKESCEKLLTGLTIIIGGAASGKSSYGEQLVNASGSKKTYVATAQAFDAEMKAKIAAHQSDRDEHWSTVEAPLDLGPAISRADPDGVVLIDCATMWLSNLILAEHDIDAAQQALFTALESAPCPIVIVTNEVGQGIVPDNALARRFRNAQGRLNQALAARADCVVTVIAGLPLALKGKLPE